MIASQYVDYDDKKICAYLLNLRHLRAIFTYLFLLLSYIYSLQPTYYPVYSSLPPRQHQLVGHGVTRCSKQTYTVCKII